ncbi:olfactory receptor 10A7-like [Leptodactylus fuscus]
MVKAITMTNVIKVQFLAYLGLPWVMQRNKTDISIREFAMLGFEVPQTLKTFLFVVFLITYIFTISGNFLIISLVFACKQLNNPMYFFLSNLSVCEIFLTTNIIPNMLHLLIVDRGLISVSKCLMQFYFFGSAATTECLLLAVMAYDRYLAICNPLHYTSIMDQRLCVRLSLCVWMVGLMATIGTIILMSRLQFCGTTTINHYFCDREPILSLSCSDTTQVRMEALVFSFFITLWPFVTIVWSYVKIILTILRMTTLNERYKTFSTCSSHLIVVCMYYGTLIIMYVVPSSGQSSNVNKLLSLLYIVVTPLLNPIIYSLRNLELRNSLKICARRGLRKLLLKEPIELFIRDRYKEINHGISVVVYSLTLMSQPFFLQLVKSQKFELAMQRYRYTKMLPHPF